MDSLSERFPYDVELNDGTTVRLRLMQSGDAERMVALFEGIQDDELRVMRDNLADAEAVRRLVRESDPQRMLVILAEQGGTLGGQAALYRFPGTRQAHLGELRIFVREEQRMRGLGRQLLDAAIEAGTLLGLEQLTAELYIDNSPMISAFERRGFVREAILPVYQMVVMRYDLTAAPRGEGQRGEHAAHLPPRALWPDLRFDAQPSEIPEQFNLCELLLDQVVAQGWGRRPAIHFRDEVVTYELLLGEVQRLASSLDHLGISAGQPVLLHLPNTPQAIAANLAVQRLGALSVPLIFQLAPVELEQIALESGAVAAFTTLDQLDSLRRARAAEGSPLGPIVVQGLEEHRPDEAIYSYARLVARGTRGFPPCPRHRAELGLLLYTSALRGRPQGTAHRLDGLLAVLESFGRQVWRVNEDDVIGALAPLGFAQGFVTTGLMPFRFGASVALPDDPMTVEGRALAQAIRRHRVTLLWAPPSSYREILSDPTVDELTLASLRLCSSSGEPLTEATFQAWGERFAQPIFEGFGTTEMLYAFLSNGVGMKPRPGSLGRVVPGYEVKIVSEQGLELADQEIGHLAVRGPTGTLYWNNPSAQRRVVHDGWNRLDDYAYQDEEGYFWFVARRDDLIKTRSFRIDPNEVEEALCQLPEVREAAVIGLPDPMRGQRPVAYVVAAAAVAPDEALARALIGRLRGRLADYKVPDQITFVPSLPRNNQGHLLRRVLRDQVRRGEE